MLFFKQILNVGGIKAGSERRVAARYPVYPQFPVKALLNVAARDTMGQLIKARDGEGWDWAAKLINLSATGARLQVQASSEALNGDPCVLKFDIQGYVLSLPGQIAHLKNKRDSTTYGLVFDLTDPATQRAYNQLLDLVALGSSLKLAKPMKPDSTGYLYEKYNGMPDSHLSIWRSVKSREVEAFEFVLKDSMVRGLAGRPGVECLNGTVAAKAKPASPAKAGEIKRLYQWVVLNLAPTVPDEVRDFLQQHAV